MRVQLLTDANRKEVARYEEMREEIRMYRFFFRLPSIREQNEKKN